MKYFKTTFRSLKREKAFTLINLIGLSIGMFCFLVTALYVKDEVTFDRWHKNADQIYMATFHMQREDGEPFNVSPSYALFNALKKESPEVINAVNIDRNGWDNYKLGEEWIQTKDLYFTSSELFEVFDFSLKYGDSKTALNEPLSVVISSEVAETLFPGENPIGKNISLKNLGDLSVLGVLKPIPKNSHLQFDFIASINHPKSRYSNVLDDWVYGKGFSYFLLREGYSLDKLLRDTEELLERNGQKELAKNYDFLKFSDLYLSQKTGRYGNYMFGGQKKYIYIFSLIGGLILFVACFNYINLATSSSINTTKQMGIRKVIGASRSGLIANKMLETLFLAFFSLVIALIGVEIALPYVNELIGKQLTFNLVESPDLIALPALVLIVVVLISGIYPAVVLSSFNLSSVLRGVSRTSKSGIFKKSLIVLQFTICSGLLVAALAIRGQADFLINMDKGYNEENIMSMSLYQEGQKLNYETLKGKLLTIPQIEAITSSPLPIFPPPPPPSIVEIDGKKFAIFFLTGAADKNFNEMFQLEILEGTDFSQVPDSELSEVAIINETAKKKLGLNPAIGAKLPSGKRVIGVVNDFFYQSAKNEIDPASIEYSPRNFNNIQFSYREGNKDQVLAQVELSLKDFGLKSTPILSEVSGVFDDQSYYEAEATLKKIFNLLTGTVILVAFLGLFALASYETNAREKEIGIMKVLGANYLHLLKALNKHFFWLMFLAFAISLPVTFYLVEKWLQAFPYRLESLGSFGLTSVLTITTIAAIILGFHCYFSAQKNPVDVLKNE
ncbi:ABC transporter permease [Roseivirga echinicomitans]